MKKLKPYLLTFNMFFFVKKFVMEFEILILTLC